MTQIAAIITKTKRQVSKHANAISISFPCHILIEYFAVELAIISIPPSPLCRYTKDMAQTGSDRQAAGIETIARRGAPKSTPPYLESAAANPGFAVT
jgi:hypothetical protein